MGTRNVAFKRLADEAGLDGVPRSQGKSPVPPAEPNEVRRSRWSPGALSPIPFASAKSHSGLDAMAMASDLFDVDPVPLSSSVLTNAPEASGMGAGVPRNDSDERPLPSLHSSQASPRQSESSGESLPFMVAAPPPAEEDPRALFSDRNLQQLSEFLLDEPADVPEGSCAKLLTETAGRNCVLIARWQATLCAMLQGGEGTIGHSLLAPVAACHPSAVPHMLARLSPQQMDALPAVARLHLLQFLRYQAAQNSRLRTGP